MSVRLSSDICWDSGESGALESFHGSCFEMDLGYLVYCGSHDIDWTRCTSSWFLCYFSMWEVYDVPLRRACSTGCRNVDKEAIRDCILLASSVPFLFEDLPLVPTNHGQGYRGFSKYQHSEVLGSEGPLEFPEAGNFDVHAVHADVKDTGIFQNWLGVRMCAIGPLFFLDTPKLERYD